MNAAGIPPLKITGSDSKKDSKEIRNYLEIALQGPLNSKGIKMNAAERPPINSQEVIPKRIPTKCKIVLVSTHSPLTQNGSK